MVFAFGDFGFDVHMNGLSIVFQVLLDMTVLQFESFFSENVSRHHSIFGISSYLKLGCTFGSFKKMPLKMLRQTSGKKEKG
jgi:hypothetical protein